MMLGHKLKVLKKEYLKQMRSKVIVTEKDYDSRYHLTDEAIDRLPRIFVPTSDSDQFFHDIALTEYDKEMNTLYGQNIVNSDNVNMPLDDEANLDCVSLEALVAFNEESFLED